MNSSGCLSRQVSPSHPSSEAVLTLAKSLASSQNAATASRTANCPWRCISTASTARWVIFFFFLTDAYKWKCQSLATSHRDIISSDVWQIFFPFKVTKYGLLDLPMHSMATANLRKSDSLVTNFWIAPIFFCFTIHKKLNKSCSLNNFFCS